MPVETGLAPENSPFPYQLTAPDRKLLLPDELREISGIAWINEQVIAAIQDEAGIIYHVSLTDGQVVARFPFGPDGDYEDLAIAGDTAFVVRSDGTVFQVAQYASASPQVEVFDTPLSSKQDVEGLCSWKNQLLLACKGDAGLGKDNRDQKAVYAWNRDTKELAKKPLFVLDLAAIAKEKNQKKLLFHPSGIAAHPSQKALYVIASDGNALMALDEQGVPLLAKKLSVSQFEQPEGVCFSPNGTLLISSEGKDSSATIQIFQQKDE